MLKWTLFLFGAFVSFGAWNQTSTPSKIKGIVYTTEQEGDHTGHDHAPGEHVETLPGASVYWKGTNIGTSTDIQGIFRLETTTLTDTLAVSFVGYGVAYVAYEGQKMLEIILNPGKELGEAVVEAERENVSISLIDPLNAQRISSGELKRDACCNLSESFESNASVDAAFTDAVTGTRQIKMLGLDGKYSQILKDNIPNVRGLGVIYGLGYIPGPWINEIFISKGAGSVTSGYESITGEINVAMKNPENSEKFHLNMYANQGGRLEMNVHTRQKVSETWGTTVMLHSEWNNQRMDNNGDGFLDNPLKEDIVLRNEWHLNSKSGVNGVYQITGIQTRGAAGQLAADRNGEVLSNVWGMHQQTTRVEASAKTGYIFKRQNWRSFGSQISGVYHQQDARFGDRNYSGKQESFRANLLYSSILSNSNHKFVTGVSFIHDAFDERLDSTTYRRTEQVPGAYFEYTWTNLERFSLVAGMRLDQHNIYGLFWSPRLHARYSINELNSIKLSAGKGYRTSNVIMENVGRLASNREWIIRSGNLPGFGLEAEEAWNFGINYVSKFKLNYREATLSVDAYHTNFVNQTVMDMDADAGQLLIYNLDGASFSNSAQAEFAWTPRRRLEMRLAYRWLDVQTDYEGVRRSVPFVSKHRGFLTMGYKTKPGKNKSEWRFDGTIQWIGQQRLPDTSMNPEEFQVSANAPDYVQINAQISRAFSPLFELYLGAENLGNFRQDRPIVSAEDPFGEYFDASMMWGPVFGRMIYGGLRWTIE
jgi:outer membrane receptor for ferrienterochelin and colicins